MAIFLVVLAGASGMPWLKPLQAIGATLVGPGGLGGSGQAIYGAFLHALASAALGLLYAAIFPRDFPPLCAAVVGAGYALLALAIMASMVVPIVNPSFRAEMQPIGGSWVVAHALFGAAMGLWWALGGRSSPDGGGAVGLR
jgi:hypothetical protein